MKRLASTGWTAMVACFLLLLGSGCRRPSTPDVPPPPPSRDVTTGSLQTVYSNPVPTSNTGNANTPTSNQPAKIQRSKVIPPKNTPMLGKKDAIVTIVEFSDFQCPFCSRGASAIKKLYKKYPDKVRVFFMQFPLDFHKDAPLAAQAALAAHAQGKFWEYHDLLFKDTSKLKRPNLDAYAKELKLDMKKFKLALDKGLYKKRMEKEMEDGAKVKVSGTPTIFLNGRKTSFSDLEKVTKEELKANKKLVEGEGLTGDALYNRLLEGSEVEEVKALDIFVGDAPSTGGDNATVDVVAFGDFQCPSFAGGAATALLVAQAYKGKVRYAFKHYPHHGLSQDIAQAGVAAHAFGLFWPYYNKLLANKDKLDRQSLIAYAEELGMDKDAFTQKLDAATTKGIVEADTKQAKGVGLANTVGFYVNGIKIEGASSFDAYKKVIDKILIKQGVKEADLPKGPPPAKISLAGVPIKGAKDAIVSIVEFSDFQCPFCSRVVGPVKKALRLYKGKVSFAFKHFPLGFHKQAKEAAVASMAAHKQGKFWAYHDLMFAKLAEVKEGRPAFLRFAQELKLDVEKFTVDLDDASLIAHVEKDQAEGSRVGVSGTPTFFINGVKQESGGTLKALQKGINAVLLAKGFKEADLPKGPSITIKDAPVIGKRGAPVVIAEYSDFQCPFCARAGRTIKKVIKMYPGKVVFAFKHFPLSFHKQAKEAAIASMAAHKQGKFWAYHDKLFDNMKDIKAGRPSLLRFAQDLKLDVAKFTADLDNPSIKEYVENDMDEGSGVGVSGTPSFFVNGKSVKSPTFDGLQKAINEALIAKGFKAEDLPKGPPPIKINIDGAPSKGSNKPKVTLVEFSDFQCPFCSSTGKMLGQFAKRYKDHVMLVFKQFPLSFHKEAHLAAQAALAAFAQGKFWKYHDLLFANQRKLYKADLLRYAQQLNCDMGTFKNALDTGLYKSQVDADMSEGSNIGVSGTPTLFINNKKYEGRINMASLIKYVNPLLIKAGVPAASLPQAPSLTLKVGNAPFKGVKDAPVTVTEFSDFQCPFCTRAAAWMTKVVDAFPGKVRLAFMQYPLGFHKDAHLAAQASLAAHAQGKFWEYHDLLFQNTRTLKRANLDAYAQQLGLNMDKFKKDLDQGTYKAQVDDEMRHGTEVGVQGTPTFFINGKKYSGKYNLEAFKQAVTAELKRLGK